MKKQPGPRGFSAVNRQGSPIHIAPFFRNLNSLNGLGERTIRLATPQAAIGVPPERHPEAVAKAIGIESIPSLRRVRQRKRRSAPTPRNTMRLKEAVDEGVPWQYPLKRDQILVYFSVAPSGNDMRASLESRGSPVRKRLYAYAERPMGCLQTVLLNMYQTLSGKYGPDRYRRVDSAMWMQSGYFRMGVVLEFDTEFATIHRIKDDLKQMLEEHFTKLERGVCVNFSYTYRVEIFAEDGSITSRASVNYDSRHTVSRVLGQTGGGRGKQKRGAKPRL